MTGGREWRREGHQRGEVSAEAEGEDEEEGKPPSNTRGSLLLQTGRGAEAG